MKILTMTLALIAPAVSFAAPIQVQEMNFFNEILGRSAPTGCVFIQPANISTPTLSYRLSDASGKSAQFEVNAETTYTLDYVQGYKTKVTATTGAQVLTFVSSLSSAVLDSVEISNDGQVVKCGE